METISKKLKQAQPKENKKESKVAVCDCNIKLLIIHWLKFIPEQQARKLKRKSNLTPITVNYENKNQLHHDRYSTHQQSATIRSK